MPQPTPQTVVDLGASRSGDDAATSRLILELYDELRLLARSYLARERPGTLQPTALVHEAFLKMVQIREIDWQSRTHFYAMAATQMRRILVDRARAASALKRGGRAQRISLSDDLAATGGTAIEVLAVDEALLNLAARNPRRSQIAELRIFAGMQFDEIAAAVEVSEKTARVEWKKARVTLARALGGGPPPS